MNENLAFIYGICVGVIVTGLFVFTVSALRNWQKRRDAEQLWEDGQ